MRAAPGCRRFRVDPRQLQHQPGQVGAQTVVVFRVERAAQRPADRIQIALPVLQFVFLRAFVAQNRHSCLLLKRAGSVPGPAIRARWA